MLDKDGQTILNDLRWHWEDHYQVDFREGKWLAAPVHDPFAIISSARPPVSCERPSGGITPNAPHAGSAGTAADENARRG